MARSPWLLLLLPISCSLDPAEPEDSPGTEATLVASAHQHMLKADSNESVERFVASHLSEDVHSLWLTDVSCDHAGFAQLKRVNRIYRLTLSGPWMAEPIGSEAGRFVFKNALSDPIVNEIAQIKTLRRLEIWYGSLSIRQRETLRRALPKCQFSENLNKI